MTRYRSLSTYDRESFWLAAVALSALAGLALCWWLG